jgi:Plant transposon protein
VLYFCTKLTPTLVLTTYCYCVSNFVAIYYTEFIKIPSGALDKVLRQYELLGFPGTVGSVDITRILLGKCPKEFMPLCVGKEEGVPTIGYEVCVTHDRLIIFVLHGRWGANNDKTISNIDQISAQS